LKNSLSCMLKYLKTKPPWLFRSVQISILPGPNLKNHLSAYLDA